MAKEKLVAPEENPGTKKLLGTFTAPPPLCLGEPYVTGGINAKRGERLKGKQFTGGVLKHEKSNVAPGTFCAPMLLWSEQKDQYADKIQYSKIFGPDRKKNGFGTSDYPRRDEFSNTIRTEQMRDILKKEGKATKKAKKERESRTVALGTGSQILSNTGLDGSLPAPPLFDVIYRIPEASMRLARDDRQAALWYKSERKKMDAGEPRGEVVRPHITEPAWVNCAIAGRSYNVLVDVDGKVLARKEAIDPVKKQEFL